MSTPAMWKQDYSEHGGFESLFFMNLGMEEKALLQAVQEIFSNHACGTVFRVKGFSRMELTPGRNLI